MNGEIKCINLAASREESTVGTEKAVRVAFLPMGVSDSPAGARGLKDVDGNRASLIWEPSAGERIPAAAEMGTGVLPYEGFKAAFSSVAADQLGANGYAETIPTTFDGEKDLLELQAGINKVRVYIWLEGQDVDCLNDISFGDFTTSLNFSVPEAE